MTHENPIHRPLQPTPDHNVSETSPTNLRESGETVPSPAPTTPRRTVKVKTMASRSEVIFTENAGFS